MLATIADARSPCFRTNGDLQTPAYVTVMHNGVLVQNHFELLGPTNYVAAPHYEPHAEKAPIRIQFHGNPVRFRNIWVRELQPAQGRRVSAPFNIKPQVRIEPARQHAQDAEEDAEDADEDEWEEDDDDDWLDDDDNEASKSSENDDE